MKQQLRGEKQSEKKSKRRKKKNSRSRFVGLSLFSSLCHRSRLGEKIKRFRPFSPKQQQKMPYISSPDDGTQIWYELVDELKEAENGAAGAEASPSASSSSGGGSSSSDGGGGAAKPTLSRRKRPRLVFIMGMGATSGCWGPQVDALAKSGVRAQALLLDNRGVGKSGSPRSKKSYSTTTMARDVLACMVRQVSLVVFAVSLSGSVCFFCCLLWADYDAMFRQSEGEERGWLERELAWPRRKRTKLNKLPALRCLLARLLPDFSGPR